MLTVRVMLSFLQLSVLWPVCQHFEQLSSDLTTRSRSKVEKS